jgi:hypothetical protein
MNFTLTVSQDELLVISEALGELSFKKSAALINKLQTQINEQTKRPVTDAPKKED